LNQIYTNISRLNCIYSTKIINLVIFEGISSGGNEQKKAAGLYQMGTVQTQAEAKLSARKSQLT